jgi:WD40 repeat protein/serine/threonine protein kinase
MASEKRCPPRDVLAKFVLGQLSPPEVEQWSLHVEKCPPCTATLHDLKAEDTVTTGLKDPGQARATRENPRVQELIVRLMGLKPGQEGATAGPGQSVSGAEGGKPEDCDFLAPAQAPGEIGRLGGYRVLKVLGTGGMGMVFLAQDPQLERLVALKAMKPSLAASAQARQRFLREAKLTAAIENDHIVAVHQVGEDRGVPFLVMPLLQGESLADRLEREGTLPLAEALDIARQAALGLAAAHARGLIHRDIKPANLWLEAQSGEPGASATGGRVKILDFGLARAVEGKGDLTQSGQLLGTPAYMAPEQARGEAVDHRCDLFSLGSVLYRMCTGEKPFQGSDVMSTLLALAGDDPQPPREVNPAVPAELSDLVLQLLSKDPKVRPASAEEAAERLQAISRVRTQAAVRAKSAPQPTPTLVQPGPQRPRSRRPVLVAVALFLLLTGGFAAYQLIFRTQDGTLIVEVDGDADVRFQKGELRIYDTDGNLKYTLKPSEKNRTLPPGKYLVEVAGADGLKVDTEKFEIIRGDKTKVRVTVDAAAVVGKPAPTHNPYRSLAELAFRRGGGVILDTGGPLIASADKLPNRAFKLASINVNVGPEASMKDLLARLKDLPDATIVSFYLGGHPVTEEAFEALVKLPSLKEVCQLQLTHIPVTDASLRHLRHLPKLNGLILANAAITGDSMKVLRDQMAVTLYLGILDPPPGFTEEALQYLDPRLTDFILRGKQFGDVSLAHIGKATNLDRLSILDCPGVTDDGLKRLHGLGKLRDLRLLKLPRVTRQGVEALHKALPKCKIDWDGRIIEPRTTPAAPADSLRREDIDPYELAAAGDGDPKKALPELVAVLGDSRLKQWGDVTSVALSRDGKLLASAGLDCAVRLWDPATGKVLRTCHCEGWLHSVAISQDGRTLASGGGGKPLLLDAVTGQKLRPLEGLFEGQQAINSEILAFSPDGQTVAGAVEHSIKIWETATGKVKQAIQSPAKVSGYDRRLAFSPDGTGLAVACEDATVYLWETATGKLRQTFTGHTKQVHAVAFSPDGKTLASSSEDATIRLWDPATSASRRTFQTESNGVACLAFSPDGRTLAAGNIGGSSPWAIRLWDLASGEKRSLDIGVKHVCSLCFAEKGTALAVGNPWGVVKLVDTATGKEAIKLERGGGSVTCVAVSPDGRTLATTSNERAVRLWDISTGREQTPLLHDGYIDAAAFSPDGKLLVTGGYGRLHLWEVATGESRGRIGEANPIWPFRPAFSPDGRTLAWAEDNAVMLFDLKAREVRQVLKGHTAGVSWVAFSPAGQLLASGGWDKTVRVWDLTTGKERRRLTEYTQSITRVGFSPGGQTLAVSEFWTPTLRLWDVATGKLHLAAPNEGNHLCTSLAFSPDGQTLAVGNHGAEVALWRWRDGFRRRVYRLQPQGAGVVGDVAFTPDGRHLVTGNGNGTVYVLRLAPPPAAAVEDAERKAAE